MTSDMIQNKYAADSVSSVASALQERLELTRDQSFLDGQRDIFDILARQKHNHDSWQQSMGETVSFLERARILLENAEKKISEQDQHLQMLEDTSGIDPLTGLLNRQGFSKALIREISRTNRAYSDGGLLVMFNLENLDAIQKNQGEEASIRAVKLVAQALENEIRDMDLAARTEDDEFVLLFTDTSMSKALSRLQDMALRLNRLSLIWDSYEIRISLSLGLKSYEQGAKAEQIFKGANDDLQRNRKGTLQTKSA